MTKCSLFFLFLMLAFGCGAKEEALVVVMPLIHRPSAGTCPSTRPAYNSGQSLAAGALMSCRLDTDCASGTNGRCVGNGHDGFNCSYDSCATDDQCPTDQLCDCRDLWHYGMNGPNQCLPSNCRTDADCGANGFCSPSLDPGCGAYAGVTSWHCHTPQDTCVNDSDCASVKGGYAAPFCGYSPQVGHWACSVAGCVG